MYSYNKRLKFNNEEDLEVSRSFAQGKMGWRELTKSIVEASNAMQTFEDNAECQSQVE